ncbi:MAG: lipoate--protein ligase family protein [Candidatus Hydrogenedentes bacterium]|nr:lipoate--protein ligase family protein [Candidatus Hydrogenedentota bacterium]
MRCIDYSSPDPATNLALEEALLEAVDQGLQPDTIRFWECPAPFVVLGTGQRLTAEVHEDRCLADGVPIMRRCTAGGCVLQGPGSLNFALFLTLANHPEAASLHGSYRYILDRVRAALKTLGIAAERAGISDIAVQGRKISGNAQRRRRNAILHHGTLLYRPDLDAIDRYLREPQDRPDYRGARPHRDFIAPVPATPDALKAALAAAFEAGAPVDHPPPDALARAEALAREKYAQRDWIYRR